MNSHVEDTRYAFVTGASRGLGFGFVQQLVRQGYVVFAGVRSGAEPHPEIGGVEWIPCDVADDGSIAQAAAQVAKKTDRLHLLINNAGVNKDTATGGHKEIVCSLASLDRTALLRMYSVNAVGPIMMVKHFLPLLAAVPSFVINISSCRASFHDEFANDNPNYGYRASKIALNMLTHGLVMDLPPAVRTCAVHPGYIRTDMNPTGIDDPLEQAERILQIPARWKNEWNGAFLRYDGTVYPL